MKKRLPKLVAYLTYRLIDPFFDSIAWYVPKGFTELSLIPRKATCENGSLDINTALLLIEKKNKLSYTINTEPCFIKKKRVKVRCDIPF